MLWWPEGKGVGGRQRWAKEDGNRDGKRLCLGGWACDTSMQMVFYWVYTLNLHEFVDQCLPNKFNEKRKKKNNQREIHSLQREIRVKQGWLLNNNNLSKLNIFNIMKENIWWHRILYPVEVCVSFSEKGWNTNILDRLEIERISINRLTKWASKACIIYRRKFIQRNFESKKV